ncbi:MAG: 6-bladed beta-propeller [Longimicrobiales bacterium]|nr:6-bladed beta-propeller [Longimicrobiales bacterium]
MKCRLQKLLLCSFLLGCNSQQLRDPPTLWTADDAQGERRWEAVRWDTLWMRGGSDDTLLLYPSLLRANATGLFLYDRGTSRLLSFDDRGALRWAYGRAGAGPGEFAGVRDVRVGDSGRVLVYDADNQRITVLEEPGSLVSFVSIPHVPRGEHIVQMGGDSVAVFTFAGSKSIVILDTAGVVHRVSSLPWDAYQGLSPLVRQGLPVSSGLEWGYLFSVGNGWFRLTAGRESSAPYIEHTDFPTTLVSRDGRRTTVRLAERPPCSACSATLQNDTLFVHFGGRTEESNRIIDMYRWRTGEYLASYRLPMAANGVAIHEARHYVDFIDPFPHVLALVRQPFARTPPRSEPHGG